MIAVAHGQWCDVADDDDVEIEEHIGPQAAVKIQKVCLGGGGVVASKRYEQMF